MKYSDITKTEDVQTSIDKLSTNANASVTTYKTQYEISDKRGIMDKVLRPDKQIKDEQGNVTKTVKVNRIPISLQERIVDTTVSFTFGNPVEMVCEQDDPTAQTILTAVGRMLKDSKIDSHNRRMARELARTTEVAECWFPVAVEKHDHYGFTTRFKIKVQLFSPWNGDVLHPVYDETGNMIAFARSFERKVGEKVTRYFEVYTDEEKIVWQNEGADGWTEFSKEPNVLKKIPVIYGAQEHVEWHNVQDIITRLEKLFSNFGDTNDYFGSPILAIKGDIKSLPDKESSSKVIEMEAGSEAEFLSWTQAPEAIKLETETLLRLAYSLTQTPDISFDSVKGLQEISGEALKMLFMDAHLKVMKKREILDEYLQRRINILKAYVGILNTGIARETAKLEIEPKIVPFTITSLSDTIERLMTANGNKAIISRRTAIAQSGLVDDVDKELKDIEEEEERSRSFDVFETAK